MYIRCYLDTLETKAILYTHIKTALHFSMNGFGQFVQIIDYLMIKKRLPKKNGKIPPRSSKTTCWYKIKA